MIGFCFNFQMAVALDQVWWQFYLVPICLLHPMWILIHLPVHCVQLRMSMTNISNRCCSCFRVPFLKHELHFPKHHVKNNEHYHKTSWNRPYWSIFLFISPNYNKSILMTHLSNTMLFMLLASFSFTRLHSSVFQFFLMFFLISCASSSDGC